MTYSFNGGQLVPTGSVKVESNMSYVEVVDDKSLLFAVHEVSSYDPFGKTGAISRWKIEPGPAGQPPKLTKLQVIFNGAMRKVQLLENP